MADSQQTTATEDPPQQTAPTASRPEKKPEHKPKKSLGRRIGEHPIKFVILLIVLAGLAVGGYIFWNYLESYESTDDAQVDGDIYAVTSRIAGTIKAVYVEDNQAVKVGQLLVELDPKDYQVALDQAEAALNESRSLVAVARPSVPITSVATESSLTTSASDIAEARAAAAAAQRDYESAVADTRKAEADNVKAQADLMRYKQLIAKDEISQQQYDQADAAAKSAAANVEAKRASAEAAAREIEQAQARLEGAQTKQLEVRRNGPQQVAIQNATVRSREATAAREQTLVEQAQLGLQDVYGPGPSQQCL